MIIVVNIKNPHISRKRKQESIERNYVNDKSLYSYRIGDYNGRAILDTENAFKFMIDNVIKNHPYNKTFMMESMSPATLVKTEDCNVYNKDKHLELYLVVYKYKSNTSPDYDHDGFYVICNESENVYKIIDTYLSFSEMNNLTRINDEISFLSVQCLTDECNDGFIIDNNIKYFK